MESEVMSECGAWKNFDEIEDNLCVDELFILYEKASERQGRLMKTIAAAFGGGEVEEAAEVTAVTTPVRSDKGNVLFPVIQENLIEPGKGF